MNKNSPMTIEEIANRMSAAGARAAKGLREVSDAIAELRDAEMMLRGLAASQTIAAENCERTDGETFAHPISERLAYPINELASKLGIHRRTIERRIEAGTLKAITTLGRRLVTAESVRATFETGRVTTTLGSSSLNGDGRGVRLRKALLKRKPSKADQRE